MTESFISRRKRQRGVPVRPQIRIRELIQMRIKTQVEVTLGRGAVTREEDTAILVARRATHEGGGVIRRRQEGGTGIRALGLNEGMYHLESPRRRNHPTQKRSVLRRVEEIQHQTLQHRRNREMRESWDIIPFLSMWK